MTHGMAHMPHSKADMTTGAGIIGVAAMAALVGAAAALLFAPRTGQETRQGIRRKMHEAQERSKQKAQSMKDSAVDTVDGLRDRAEDTAQDIADQATEARARVDDIAAESMPRTRRRSSNL